MGLSPEVWGRAGWRFIHAVALTYPVKPTEKEKKIYASFLQSLGDVLPCPFCGEHFKQNMKNHPPNLDSRKTFFNWTVDMHNFVNVSNNKPEISYEEALDNFNKEGDQTKLFDINFVKGILASVVISGLILTLAYKLSRN
jgi:FAD-linked sulfhydryl oxidase